MIPIASLQKTAEQLMAKAAIEIPDDYLGGLRAVRQHREGRPVVVRDPGHAGELRGGQGRPARHVRRYRRAALVRQDRQRGAQRGRADRAGGGAAARHGQRHARRAAAAQPRASALAHGPQQQLRHRRAGDRVFVPPRCRLDRPHHRAQGRAVRLRLPHAVSRRRHRRHQALLSRHADPVRPARARLPAGHRRRRARRLQGHLHGAGQAGRRACAPSARAIPIPRSRRWRTS